MRALARSAVVMIGAALVAGAAAPAVGAASVPAAKSPGWRIIKSFGCAQGNVYAVTSTGPRGAWAGGQWAQCSPGAITRVLVARWDGRSWQEPPLPSAFAAAYGVSAVAALSNSYAWIFAFSEAGPFAALYRSGAWRTFQLPAAPNVTSAVAFSRSNAWAFGVTYAHGGEPYAARFNGRVWRRVMFPLLPSATAAPAPGNIWAVGYVPGTSQPRWALAHWTGRWQVHPLPDPPSGESIYAAWVDWDNPHAAWIVASLVPGAPHGSYGGLLLHWTGTRWIDVKVPFQTFGLGPMAHDGHGGLWIASDSCGSCLDTDMVHYNAARGWSTPVPVGPVGIQAMRLIPGTDSVLAAGTRYSSLHNATGRAVILKYGP